MLVYQNYLTFKIMDQEIKLISDETVYGRNTVVEMNGKYHYMGEEPGNVATAVFAWQESNGRDLSSEELHQVMVDNQLISGAI